MLMIQNHKIKNLLKILSYIIGIFITGILSGHLTFKLLSFNKTVTVPDLRGKSMIEADNILQKSGLYIRLEGEDFDPTIPKGYIIWQNVPPDSSVKEGREIKVILSKGTIITYIPDVSGQPVDQVVSLLRDKGITLKKIIYVHSDSIDRNTVIAQRPEPGENSSDNFNIIVSAGEYDR